MCAEILPKGMSGQTDGPLSEVSGRSQETGCIYFNLQSQLFTGRCVS